MTFSVTLQPSGHRYDVPAGKSILAAGLEAGHFMPYSCKQGVCNTCKGRIVEGSVDYGDVHPAYFSEADRAGGYALLCQARPLADCDAADVRVGAVPCLRTRARAASGWH